MKKKVLGPIGELTVKLSSLILFILLSGCATNAHHQCVEYMWVPNVDAGHLNYNMQRPICVEWSDK